MTRFHTLEEPQRRVIEIACEAGASLGTTPWLVGGPVRDLLLGVPVTDLDFLVEERAEEFARALAHRCGASVNAFPQFMTWKLVGSALGAIDVATSRRESYPEPGALPVVERAPIREDLLRRDFSINSIALSLGDGAYADPANGRADLERRAIRVLHDRSFLNDPTRIFRAFRFAARLGFALDERTRELAEAAIAAGALERVSRERLWRELYLAMEEKGAGAALAAILRSGAAEGLLPGAERVDLEARLASVAGVLPSVADADREVAFLIAILAEENRVALRAEGSGLSERRRRGILSGAASLTRTVEAIGRAHGDAEKYAVCRAASRELLAVAAAASPSIESMVMRYLASLRREIGVRGDQLGVPPGPHVARALDRTRQALFAGEIAAHDARTFACAKALQYLREKPPAPR
ncbi:MAG: tRNA nucleotidyltransferase/poly(A) polymerase family protein [Thermoanaerobaculia bacterium]